MYVPLCNVIKSQQGKKETKRSHIDPKRTRSNTSPPPSGTLQRRERASAYSKKERIHYNDRNPAEERTAPDALTKASVTSSYPRRAFLLLGLFANDCQPGGVFTKCINRLRCT